MAGNAQTIIDLDRKRMQAMATKDIATLEALIADDLIYTHSSARIDTKQSLIGAMQSGATVYTGVEPSDVKAQDFGDVVVLTGTAQIKVTSNGTVSAFVEGPPLAVPNGVAIDHDGNIVVVNIGNNTVLTFNPAGALVRTENAVESGNDGLVIAEDGTKYVSSVRFGSVSKIAPGKEAEVIAEGIPAAASMCYDSKQNQLVIPMNPHNALAFIKL